MLKSKVEFYNKDSFIHLNDSDRILLKVLIYRRNRYLMFILYLYSTGDRQEKVP